jgi:4-azaleucine resistance transporter AzlC
MKPQNAFSRKAVFFKGVQDGVPLIGGYVSVAISFGLISIQTGLSPWAAIAISIFVYAGGSQFLLVGLLAAGAPAWLLVILSLLINARHMVYGPNIAPWITSSRWWPLLMHGLTDQVFAISLARLPTLPDHERLIWFTGLMLTAWFSWVGGTLLGAYSGEELLLRWPMISDISAFALPALFLVLIAPMVTSLRWLLALSLTAVIAMVLASTTVKNFAVPISAVLGAASFYSLKFLNTKPKG